jgi:adenylylsulfate kinase
MRHLTSGRIVWFIGLSGSGKSTLCLSLQSELLRRGQLVKILDGDELRRGLCSDLGFSEQDRAENIRRIAHVADLVSRMGVIVLVATICPFQRLREVCRAQLPDMVEVFVDAPLAVCERRDPKGLYRLARSGKLSGFTGVDSPFEVPQSPDIVCHTHEGSVADCTIQLLNYLGFRPLTTSTSGRRLTIAVDFDGVIANYDGWKGIDVLGEPRLDVIKALEELRKDGWKIIVHTTRASEHIRPYLVSADVPFDEINTNADYQNCGQKPVATVYWDDRALRYSGDAARDLSDIRNFRTWSERQ